jgi:acyl carrier protein
MALLDRIRELVVEELHLDGPPGDDTHLHDQLGLDSAGLMALAVALEEEFGVELEETEFTGANFESVNSITRLVEGRLSQ